MSEFTLPANSKVKEGKRWAAPEHAEHVKSFRIYRWDPEKGENPTLDTFEIDRDCLRADGSRRAGQDQ